MKNPYLNATFAALYIVGVVFLINATADSGPDPKIVTPLLVLSLLTLSVAVMGFLFAYKPLTMYIDGGKKEALNFFLKTLTSFAVYVIVFLAIFVVFRDNVPTEISTINSFEECADAGYPVGESYPRQCWTPDGEHFVEEVE